MFNRSRIRRFFVATVLGLAVGSAPGQQPEAAEAAGDVGGADHTGGVPNILTNLNDIVALGQKVQAQRYEAYVEGVVIYVSPGTRRLYLQSGERGLQANLKVLPGIYRPGQRVGIRGTILEGSPDLRLSDCQAAILGEGPLPEPKRVSPHRLATGVESYRYVSIRGVVRDMVTTRDTIELSVAHEGLVFAAYIQADHPALPREWLDAEVELRGHSWPVRNSNGRASGFRFHLFSTNALTVLTPGVPDRFGRPLLTCREAGNLPQQWGPRVRISGTVTASRPDVGFYLDDGTGVMLVQLLNMLPARAGGQSLDHEPQTPVQPGERVEVIGVRHNWYSLAPTLIQAELRRAGRGSAIQPRRVTVDDLMEGRYPGQLVTLDAWLLDRRQLTNLRMHSDSMVFRAGDQVFQGRWESETSAQWDLQLDTYVRLTGINDAEGSASRRRSTFQLLFRTPADVVPIRPPPFWAGRDFRRIALGAGGVALVGLALLLFQRRELRRLEARVVARTTDLSGANSRLQDEILARQRAEADLRLALSAEKELGRLKSSFVSMVSHEFRTPLEVILSSSHILDRYLDRLAPEKRHDQLRAIRTSVHRMSDLMEDVLTLGKLEAARLTCAPAPLDLAAFCRHRVEEIETATHNVCPIRWTARGVEGPALADEALLSHVVSNLLSNAVKYSPPGTPVDFTVERVDRDVRLIVRDAGLGIPAEDQAHLFTAFHRARNVNHIPGSGLGLVIVKRCVELHGGTIECLSAEGQGTTFTVTLPLFEAPGGSPSTPTVASGPTSADFL